MQVIERILGTILRFKSLVWYLFCLSVEMVPSRSYSHHMALTCRLCFVADRYEFERVGFCTV